MLRAVIFDCDGVLFHSERANFEFFNTVLARLGLPPLDAEGERMARAMAGAQLVAALFRDQPELAQRATEIARALDYGPFYRWMQPVDQLHETLATLRGSYRLAMATNRGVTAAEVMRRFGLDRYLQLAVGTLDVERPKPAPDMLHKCLVHLDVTPAEALYVGDTDSDQLAAASAGLRFVAVGQDLDSEYRVAQLHELPDLIRSQGW